RIICLMLRPRPLSTLFPYTTLFRSFHLSAEMSEDLQHVMRVAQVRHAMNRARLPRQQGRGQNGKGRVLRTADPDGTGERIPAMQDRKSTRLNSSHVAISYAVFCLKK